MKMLTNVPKQVYVEANPYVSSTFAGNRIEGARPPYSEGAFEKALGSEIPQTAGT